MRQPPAWQRALRDAITAPADLLAAVGLGPSCCRSASTTLSSPGVLASRSRGSSSCIRITRTRSTRRCAPHCDALVDLSEALVAAGVLPYYRHLLDPVAGAAHFAVPESEARALAAGIAASLPGYLAPRLVREVPGAAAKTLLPPASR